MSFVKKLLFNFERTYTFTFFYLQDLISFLISKSAVHNELYFYDYN